MGSQTAPWAEGPGNSQWASLAVSRNILGEDRQTSETPIPVDWARTCAFRIRVLRDWMREHWAGLDDRDRELGPLTDWVIATAIARENCLLLGKPGVAKSEIATQMFKWLGLTPPSANSDKLRDLNQADVFDRSWWERRAETEREEQKYFHYLLSRFSQVEELFGPIELELLKKGVMVRVNFGLLTGPGVRAAFLDEVFKASSAVLNTLLTLTQERTYFNWGGMEPSDIVTFIGASNELPGGFATGMAGQGTGGEDFHTLHAFLDRFPIRLEIPVASGTSNPGSDGSDLEKAFDKAVDREARKFATGRGFADQRALSADKPCMNDILLLGRCCLQGAEPFFAEDGLSRFRGRFLALARELQRASEEGHGLSGRGNITWTITPRKLRSIYKVALALALVRDDDFAEGSGSIKAPSIASLRVFDLIWDSPASRPQLYRLNDPHYQQARGELRS